MLHRETIRGAYDRLAPALREQYSKLNTADVLPEVTARMPRARLLDVGCGTGYSAKWFAEQGYVVDACDLSEGMLTEARTHYAHERVTYYQDALPELATTRAKGHSYDMIVLSAVWMHIDPSRRAQALENLMRVAAPGATLLLSLRHGAAPADRPMFETSVEEMQHLAALNLSRCDVVPTNADQLGRSNVWWDTVYLKVPEKHEAQLALIKQVALQAQMSAPHKPVLMHSLSNAATMINPQDAFSSAISMANVLPHWLKVYDSSPLPAFLRAGSKARATDTLRKGPLAAMRDPETNTPLFRLERGDTGALQLLMPRALGEALQTYPELIGTGCVAAVDRHLGQRKVTPEARQHFRRQMG